VAIQLIIDLTPLLSRSFAQDNPIYLSCDMTFSLFIRSMPNNANDAVDGDLESWNPMAEDYANKAFNNYTEPTTLELKKWMPK